MSPRLTSISDLRNLRRSLKGSRDGKKPCITICAGTGCQATNALDVVEKFRQEIMDQHLAEKIEVRASGCHGFCERGPLAVIRPQMICYMNVETTDVSQITTDTLLEGKIIDRLLCQTPLANEKITHEQDIPFYKFQQRIVFGSNGEIDPTQIDDYIAIGGYQGLEKVLFEMRPEQVIDIIKQSGLRGRGGGGFSTGIKWESCRKAKGKEKC